MGPEGNAQVGGTLLRTVNVGKEFCFIQNEGRGRYPIVRERKTDERVKVE